MGKDFEVGGQIDIIYTGFEMAFDKSPKQSFSKFIRCLLNQQGNYCELKPVLSHRSKK